MFGEVKGSGQELRGPGSSVFWLTKTFHVSCRERLGNPDRRGAKGTKATR